MQESRNSMEPKNHEWGWAVLIMAIVAVNLGAHVWQEFRGCKGPVAALNLCQAEPGK